MIYAVANDKTTTGFRVHVVSVHVVVKDNRYLVTVKEEWTKLLDGGRLGIEHLKEPKMVTVNFESLDDLFEESEEVFGGFSSLGEAEGIDQVLLGEAMRSASDEIWDLLVFNGAATLNENLGSFEIDWDEAKCRRLIQKAAEE